MNKIAHKISQDLVVTELGQERSTVATAYNEQLPVKQVLIGLQGIVAVSGASRSRTFP